MIVLSQITTPGKRRLFICVVRTLLHEANSSHAPWTLRLTLILCLVLHLCGGSGYPEYILTKAAELNNDNETLIVVIKGVKLRFNGRSNKILNYWFPPTEGYDVCPRRYIPDSRSFNDFTITFIIEINLKPPSARDFQLDSGR